MLSPRLLRTRVIPALVWSGCLKERDDDRLVPRVGSRARELAGHVHRPRAVGCRARRRRGAVAREPLGAAGSAAVAAVAAAAAVAVAIAVTAVGRVKRQRGREAQVAQTGRRVRAARHRVLHARLGTATRTL